MDAERDLEAMLSSLDSYKKSKNYRLKILRGEQSTINSVLSVISQVLKQPLGVPIQKLLAVQLAKDCMETFNDEYITQVQLTILPLMEKIALFDRISSDPDRGKYIFSPQPDDKVAKIGNSYFRLVLECLWVWAKWFPVDPEVGLMSLYKIAVLRLVQQSNHIIFMREVTFHLVEYFQPYLVLKYTPEQQVPIMLLDEAKKVIIQDLKNQNGTGSPLKSIQAKLSVDLRKALSSNNAVITHADKMKQAMKILTNERRESKKAKAKFTMQLQPTAVPERIKDCFNQLETSIHGQQLNVMLQPRPDGSSTAYSSSNYEQSRVQLKNQDRQIKEDIKDNKSLRELNQQKDPDIAKTQQPQDGGKKIEQDNQILKHNMASNSNAESPIQWEPLSSATASIIDTTHRPNPQIRSQLANFKRHK